MQLFYGPCKLDMHEAISIFFCTNQIALYFRKFLTNCPKKCCCELYCCVGFFFVHYEIFPVVRLGNYRKNISRLSTRIVYHKYLGVYKKTVYALSSGLLDRVATYKQRTRFRILSINKNQIEFTIFG